MHAGAPTQRCCLFGLCSTCWKYTPHIHCTPGIAAITRQISTFTKASRTSSACSLLSGVDTVSPRVIRVRLVRQFIKFGGFTWRDHRQALLTLPNGCLSPHPECPLAPAFPSRLTKANLSSKKAHLPLTPPAHPAQNDTHVPLACSLSLSRLILLPSF